MTLVNRLPRTNYIVIGGTVLTLLVGVTLLNCFVTVNPGERGMIIKLGKVPAIF